jgi:hypothetical protein
VPVNPASGVKLAKKSEDDKFTEKLIDKEVYTRDCVDEIFPEVQDMELSGDEWDEDLYINGEIVGSITIAYWVNYGTGNRRFYWSTNREIRRQVKEAKREWEKAREEAAKSE